MSKKHTPLKRLKLADDPLTETQIIECPSDEDDSGSDDGLEASSDAVSLEDVLEAIDELRELLQEVLGKLSKGRAN